MVEELPAFQLLESGPYAIYRLWKCNFNTEDAIQLVCKRFNIRRSDVKFAGTKDRNAITTQYISIHRNNRKLVLDEENIKLGYCGFANEPISLGCLAGNTFELIIRDIAPEERIIFEQNMHALSDTDAFYLPNYFDEQRFSTNNVAIGLCILKNDFKGAIEHIKNSAQKEGYYEKEAVEHLARLPTDYIGALKKIPPKILLMYIHAVQSKIYNELLRQSIIELDEHARDILYSQGIFAFSQDYLVYTRLCDHSLPLLGFSTPSTPALKKQIDALSITPRNFIIRAIPELSCEGTERNAMMHVINFTSEKIDDTTLKLSFTLLKGCYATMVVKGLFN